MGDRDDELVGTDAVEFRGDVVREVVGASPVTSREGLLEGTRHVSSL